jgi:two-component system chemotaxis sensor kinase CheA
MSMAELRETFFQECEDLIEAMASGLRMIEEAAGDPETVNMVFRAVHSIKGGAGAFGLDHLVQFAHGFETTLDGLRSGKFEADPGLARVLMHAGDHLSDLVAAARDESDVDEALSARLIDELEAASGGPVEEEEIDFTPTVLSFDLDLPAAGPETQRYEIRLRPHRGLYSNGNDPALLFRDLAELGVIAVTVDASELPDSAAFDWEESYLGWSVTMETDRTEDEVRTVFEFVEGLCDLDIEPAREDADAPSPPLPEAAAHEVAAPQATGIAPPPAASAEPPSDAKPVPPAAAAEEKKAAAAPPRARPTIRVDLDRVDRLINLVGELVINQAMLAQAIESAGCGNVGSDVGMGLDELKQLSREIQEGVMAIRAQPVKPLFDRMHRIVRESAEASGKTARLLTEGEMTEVDKTVVEKLADPLTHMIRNAVDHGLEKASDRASQGKPEEGTVILSAQHRSGRVIITLSDDGGGINRPRVRQIAIEKGLIADDLELTPTEIDNLLFLPGFSTAKELSKLSGRGVGLDVVKSAIAELGGRVSIQSVPGQGTTFSISLPLTLAVLDGMIVRVAEQQLVVPITAIIETLRPGESQIQTIGPTDRVLAVRGAYVPIIDVGAALGFRGGIAELDDSVIVLVEADHDSSVALAVDAIQDQRQVVIKSLEGNYGHVPGIAAATVLGDGRIALILDTNDLAGTVAPAPMIAAE